MENSIISELIIGNEKIGPLVREILTKCEESRLSHTEVLRAIKSVEIYAQSMKDTLGDSEPFKARKIKS